MKATTVLLLACVGLTGCSSLWPWGTSTAEVTPTAAVAATHSADTSGIELLNAGLLAGRDGGAELGLSVRVTTEAARWLEVQFRSPDGRDDCLRAREVSQVQQLDFFCPQPHLQVSSAYSIELRVYAAPNQAQPVLARRLPLNIRAQELAAFKRSSKPVR